MKAKANAMSRHRDPRAVLETGCDLYEEGDRKRAARLFREAAIGGVAEAQVNLANMYDAGDGISSDFEAARYWYRRAVKQGCPEAAYNLGISYLRRNSLRWGRHWLKAAAAMGDEDAQQLLDRMS